MFTAMLMSLWLIPATVVSVTDGDTIKVVAYPWPSLAVMVSIRLRGIDTPEMLGKCQEEKQKAKEARDYLASIIGKQVTLANPENGKYAGRVVASVLSKSSEDFGKLLVDKGYARIYDGGKRQSWCN